MNDETIKGSCQPDTKFAIISASLLLLIIALLGGLWVSARVTADRYRDQVRQLRKEKKVMAGIRFSGSRDGLDAMLNRMVAKSVRRTLDRESLRTERASLNGRDVEVLRLPAEKAQALGLMPGDVMIVEKPAPTTQSR